MNKNNSTGNHLTDKVPIKHFLLIMRATFILLFTFVFCSMAEIGYTQNARVTINKRDVALKEVLNEIENQTDYLFIYNNEVNTNENVSVNLEQKAVYEILNIILEDKGVSFTMEGKHIILVPNYESIEELAELVTIIQQQNKQINGTIVDEDGVPIIGANIIESGTNNGTVTDIDGYFSINVDNNATLRVSYIGYLEQNINTSGRTSFNIILQEDTRALEEVVVVGYGTQRKVNVTGAVDQVAGEKFSSRQNANMSQLLQGVSPALNISISNMEGFQPGASMNVNIRGIGSLNGGSPYVVIDGIPGSLDNVNPEDIESISILKDAAASAIYGSRAPYGVILITTKSGEKNEKLKVTYSGNIIVRSPHNLPETVDSYTFARVINELGDNRGGRNYDERQIDRIIAYKNKDWEFIKQSINNDERSPGWPEGATIFGGFPEHGDRWNNNVLSYADNNWFDIHYGNTINQKHNISLQGGGDKISYYFSAGYIEENGVMKYATDYYNRLNVLTKIEFPINDWWDVFYDSHIIRSNREKPNMGGNGYHWMFRQTARTYPIIPLYDGYGNFYNESHIDEIQSGTDKTQEMRYINTIRTEIRPTKNWKINADFTYSNTNTSDTNILNTVIGYHPSDNSEFYESINNPNSIEEIRRLQYYWTTNIYSSYNLNLYDTHNLMIMAGMQLEKGRSDRLTASRFNLISERVPSLKTAIGNGSFSQDLSHSNVTQGYFSRISYNYLQKYLFEMNARYDGSYVFREGNRWGLFPSFSLGWNIHNEKFWEVPENLISTLKLRGSWGQLGNQQISPFSDIELIRFSSNNLNWIYNFGGTRPLGYTQMPEIVNRNLGWETSTTKNIGLDISFLNNKLQANVDVFERITSDMVGPAEEKPGVLGTAMPRMNNATLQTRGWEISLSWKQYVNQDLSYFIDFNIYDQKSLVTRYHNPEGVLSTWYTGAEVGEIWGYTVYDLFRTQNELDEYLEHTDPKFISSNWNTGDVRYEDTNKDGKVNNGKNTIYDPGDLSIIGNSQPRFQFGISAGINYKNFDFSMIWSGVGKRDIFPSREGSLYWGVNRARHQTLLQWRTLDYYRDTPGDKLVGVYEGDANINLDGFFPRPYLNQNEERKNKDHANTRYLLDASYMRLQNIRLGYSIPHHVISKLHLQHVSVYLSGENLVTLQKLPKVMDPLAIEGHGGNIGAMTYGADRVYSIGITLTY